MRYMSTLNEICDVLDTYKGRDKTMRTLCYTCKLIGALTNNQDYKRKLLKFGTIMSKTRATLRLFDDLPMLRYNLEYGIGDSEPDALMQTIGLTSNIIDTVFYPIEKVSWLAENELIERDGTAWDAASTLCWVSTVYLGLIRTLRQYMYLNLARKEVADKRTKRQLSKQQRMEILTGIRLLFDLVHSVHSMPVGFLWAGTLKPWQVGLVGTISSVIGFYQLFVKRAMARCS